MAGYIGRKMYIRRRKRIEEDQVRDALDRSRKARREQARSGNTGNGANGVRMPSETVCVVCVENPKEVRSNRLLQ